MPRSSKMLEATFDLLVPLVMAAFTTQELQTKTKGIFVTLRTSDPAWSDRSDLQYHRTVFCGESIRWILYEGAACAVLTYPVPWICGDGQAGYFHTDHANDE